MSWLKGRSVWGSLLLALWVTACGSAPPSESPAPGPVVPAAPPTAPGPTEPQLPQQPEMPEKPETPEEPEPPQEPEESSPTVLREVEPNDAAASATPATDVHLELRGALQAAGDQDYFRLTLGGSEALALELSGPAGKNLDLALHDASPAPLLASTGPGASEHLSYVPEGTGAVTVYVRVSSPEGDVTDATYSVTVTRSARPPPPPPPPPPPTTVYILRHAERASDAFDTPLSEPLGFARARAWVSILAPHAPQHLFVSTLQRTQQTLQPLADQLGQPLARRPVLYDGEPIRAPTAADSAALASELRTAHAGGVAVVCWHTPLVVDLALALGVPGTSVPAWSHDTYDHLWVVTVPHEGPATLVDTVPPFVLDL